MKKIFLILLVLMPAFTTMASVPVILTDQQEDYFIDFDKVDILEDKTGKLRIGQVSSTEFTDRFVSSKEKFPVNANPSSVYWLRFTINDNSPENVSWLIESYNFRIKVLDLYTSLGNGKYKLQKNGDSLDFSRRIFDHKNFEYLLPIDRRGPQTYYVKFQNVYPTRAILVIRAYTRFTSYALSEYFMLGLFYGMVVVIGLYNFFLFVTIRDRAYLYYVIYVFSFALFSMCQDGTGFQYLWPEHPDWNEYCIPIAQWNLVVWLLMYSKSFLNVKEKIPLLNTIINVYIWVRTLLFLLSVTVWHEMFDLHYIDLIPFLLAYIASIISYTHGLSSARYFVAGFTILLIAFLINNLRILRILPPNAFTAYSMNIGAILEMILLSIALADRIKEIKESDLLKERVNRELEKKVKERTEAFLQQKNIIKEKVQEHDNFIYKVSHDIKGPLKSIIGLTDVGMKDDVKNAHEYFKHIMKSAKRLDNIVMELLLITKVNRAKVDLEKINFKNMVEEIKGSFEHLPNYKGMRFELDIEQKADFYCENFILYSIFQNLIENAIKYRKTYYHESYLKIKIEVDEKQAKIEFADNGVGMSSEYHGKVFDMFYRIHSDKDSTGLGLYIVKISVEKLGGSIRIESQPEQGTTFYINITNFMNIDRTQDSDSFAQARNPEP
ncbi:MAG: 7TM diverse intracellular signaling domain-containing protein [Cytophagaceae bacterium]